MKKILFTFGFLLIAAISFSQTKQVWVNGYTNSYGTYVAGYYKTVLDNNATTNYNNIDNVKVNSETQNNQVWVNGYTNSYGTYVAGYYKTVSDNTATNNYNYKNNINPNTGTQGTKSLYYNTTPTENRTLYTGSKGGTYYINSSGNKVYVKNN